MFSQLRLPTSLSAVTLAMLSSSYLSVFSLLLHPSVPSCLCYLTTHGSLLPSSQFPLLTLSAVSSVVLFHTYFYNLRLPPVLPSHILLLPPAFSFLHTVLFFHSPIFVSQHSYLCLLCTISYLLLACALLPPSFSIHSYSLLHLAVSSLIHCSLIFLSKLASSLLFLSSYS